MYCFSKRLIDLVAALSTLLLLVPLLVLVAFVIRARLGRPILFRQTRIGRREQPFEIVKFRSMSDSRDSQGRLLPDEDRLCSVGRFLRVSSLDELPQLWNVVQGSMSLVGPRPLLPEYLPRYSPIQRRRHEVPPGITGWAQVQGRNSLSWHEKLAMDVWYVDHRNLLLDLRIVALTAIRVLRRDGVAAPGCATMPEFMGDQCGPQGAPYPGTSLPAAQMRRQKRPN